MRRCHVSIASPSGIDSCASLAHKGRGYLVHNGNGRVAVRHRSWTVGVTREAEVESFAKDTPMHGGQGSGAENPASVFCGEESKSGDGSGIDDDGAIAAAVAGSRNSRTAGDGRD